SSSMISSEAGITMLALPLSTTPVAPCRSTRSRPTSVRKRPALCLRFSSRPTVRPARWPGRGASATAPRLPLLRPVGSWMALGIGGAPLSGGDLQAIAQRVADPVDGEHGQDDDQAGGDGRRRVDDDELVGRVQRVAPA